MEDLHHHGHEFDRRLKGRLVLAVALTGGFFAFELAGGYVTNSLALMTDAAHNFMDFFALALSWFAIYISELPPTDTRTYGFHRVEVFVSFINSSILLLVTLGIFYEGYQRLFTPEPVKSLGVMVIATIGLAVNLIVALWLRHFAVSDMNIKSAFLHIVGDAAASLGVIAGAAVIYYTGWYLADPLIGAAIGVIIIIGCVSMLKDSSHILLEGVPREIDLNEVMEDMKKTGGVASVHSLHIWSICHNVYALSAHLDIVPVQRWRMGEIFNEINERLAEKHHIFYTTLQAECIGCNQEDIFGKIAHRERNRHLH